MADISRVKLPNNVTYDIKDNSGTNSDHRHYASDLVPLVHKKYESTSYYNQGTAGWANSSWYFMKVKPDSWYLPWKVKFKVHSYCPAYTSYQSISYCTVTGRANSTAYANFNERYDSAHYYTVVYPLKKAGFDAGYEHAIGISILYGSGYTNSAYYRTFEVDYYECENCTVTILDTPIKWADWSGNSTTNYENLVSMNAVDRGLQETGDSNTTTENRIGYFAGKTSVTHGIWAGSLFMEDANNTYQNICTAADGTATASNRTTATTKKANPNGFKVGGTIWYCNTNYNANTNIGGYAVVYSSISIFDSRYALNTSLVANSLTPYKPIYLVGTINNSNNLFYLDSVWWTQEPNDTSKVYVLIGACYDSTTSYCRITLYEQNIWYYYDGEKLCEYIYHAQNANNAITVNGHSVEKDVPSDAVFTDHIYTAATTAPEKIASSSSVGTSTNYARQDHTHGIDLATGDSNGQVKIAGTNVSVKGLGTAAYTDSNTYVSKSGDTMTGNLIVPAMRIANTYYGVSYGRTTATPKETILKTGIKWKSASHMPVIHITGYAYGLGLPVEFKIGFYIYGDKIGWCGATNMGSWKPTVYLFKYQRDSVDYVAVGLSGQCYFLHFLQLQADVQDEMGKFANIVIDTSNWSWEFLTTEGNIPTADDGTTCIQVPYKADILKDTTYSMTRSGESITLTPSSGTAQSITESSLLSALSSGTGDVTDSTLFITSHANGESGSTSYYKRAATTLFNYLKTKFGTAAQKNVPTSGNASTSQVVMGNDTRLSDARPASDVSAWAKASTKPTYTASEVGAIATSAKGANGGVAELGSDGKVPSSQLPSYVDDVLEYTNKASFPSTGESGKIYVDLATNLTYRWSGTAYTEISPSLALGETSSTAYRGDRGKTAYTHATDSSRLTTAKTSGLYKIATTAEGHVASVTAVTKADITGLGIPGSDTNTTYAFAEGTANGKFQVTPSGGTAKSVTVHGLNDLAYKSSASATYTPAGNCTGGNVTLNTTTVPNVTGVGSLPTCTFPELSLSVNSNKRLIISHTEGSFNQGSLPTLGTAITVATSIKSVTQPTFGGTQATITVS